MPVSEDNSNSNQHGTCQLMFHKEFYDFLTFDIFLILLTSVIYSSIVLGKFFLRKIFSMTTREGVTVQIKSAW